jgi:hypothetical protein
VLSWDFFKEIAAQEKYLTDRTAMLEASLRQMGMMNQQERIAYNELAVHHEQLKQELAATQQELQSEKEVARSGLPRILPKVENEI